MSEPHLFIKQSAEQTGSRRWRWAVWLEGAAEELDAIQSVTYFLHETFREPVRQVTDRSTNFRLESAGWGEFLIRANVVLRSGRKLTLTHRLSFFDESKSPDTRARVFLSFGARDRDLAESARTSLEQQAFQIVKPSIASGAGGWSTQLKRAIGEADVLLAIVGNYATPWTDREAALAEEYGVPVVVLSPPTTSTMPSSLRRITTVSTVAEAVDAVVAAVKRVPPAS